MPSLPTSQKRTAHPLLPTSTFLGDASRDEKKKKKEREGGEEDARRRRERKGRKKEDTQGGTKMKGSGEETSSKASNSFHRDV